MDQSEPKNQNAVSEAENKPADKKPYQKPEVRHERVFETMALACGKVGPTQQSCRTNRRAS
jgi:hypothetical protein